MFLQLLGSSKEAENYIYSIKIHSEDKVSIAEVKGQKRDGGGPEGLYPLWNLKAGGHIEGASLIALFSTKKDPKKFMVLN